MKIWFRVYKLIDRNKQKLRNDGCCADGNTRKKKNEKKFGKEGYFYYVIATCKTSLLWTSNAPSRMVTAHDKGKLPQFKLDSFPLSSYFFFSSTERIRRTFLSFPSHFRQTLMASGKNDLTVIAFFINLYLHMWSVRSGRLTNFSIS